MFCVQDLNLDGRAQKRARTSRGQRTAQADPVTIELEMAEFEGTLHALVSESIVHCMCKALLLYTCWYGYLSPKA